MLLTGSQNVTANRRKEGFSIIPPPKPILFSISIPIFHYSLTFAASRVDFWKLWGHKARLPSLETTKAPPRNATTRRVMRVVVWRRIKLVLCSSFLCRSCPLRRRKDFGHRPLNPKMHGGPESGSAGVERGKQPEFYVFIMVSGDPTGHWQIICIKGLQEKSAPVPYHVCPLLHPRRPSQRRRTRRIYTLSPALLVSSPPIMSTATTVSPRKWGTRFEPLATQTPISPVAEVAEPPEQASMMPATPPMTPTKPQGVPGGKMRIPATHCVFAAR